MASKSKIRYVLLMGGVGNQLFQLAKALYIRNSGFTIRLIRLDSLPLLSLYVYIYKKWTKQEDWLNMRVFAETLGISVVKPPICISLLVYLQAAKLFLSKKILDSQGLASDSHVFIGYFQTSESYDISSIVKVGEALAGYLGQQLFANHHPIIHYRTGDIAENDRVDMNTMIRFMEDHAQDTLCITNDIMNVPAQLDGINFTTSKSALEDFILLASSDRILPSDSTFCFWAVLVSALTRNVQIYRMPTSEYWAIVANLLNT
jgi:hypothetical protein